MINISVFLAQVDSPEQSLSKLLTGPAMRERLIIFGAIGLVALVLLLWAVLIRRKRRHRHSHHHHHHHHHHHSSGSDENPTASQNGSGPVTSEGKRRRRRRHHRHRPRNPTLAETGGLPPIRTDSPPEAEP